jgi:hypothetical protein
VVPLLSLSQRLLDIPKDKIIAMAYSADQKRDDIDVRHDEERKNNGDITPPQHELVEIDAKTEKKLIRKIDKRLLPILGAL